MTLAQLKAFIVHTRRAEGVSWFLVDSSPLKFHNVLYTLYVFDDNRNLVTTVTAIEEFNKKVPKHKIAAIGATREVAGMNRTFLANNRDKTNRKEPGYVFAGAKRRWMRKGFADFLAGKPTIREEKN